MIIPYYELWVKKYKTNFWMNYCLLQSCPKYTDPTVDGEGEEEFPAEEDENFLFDSSTSSDSDFFMIKLCNLIFNGLDRMTII